MQKGKVIYSKKVLIAYGHIDGNYNLEFFGGFKKIVEYLILKGIL